MAESKAKKLPQFDSTEELIDFFDTHDLGEYEEALPEVDFDVEIKNKHYLVSVEENLMGKLLEVSQEQQISVDMLVDSLLKEKLFKVS
ncbi:MAG: CopG family antitoxin [Cyanobacteria bacterium P01_F01_bin.143]